MKLYILGFVLVLTAVFAVSCDDDVNSIGGDIQPGSDEILIITDTVNVSARTILMNDIYARSTSAILGKYEDPLFGTIKSEYLFEFKGADNLIFGNINIRKENLFIDVDSVQLAVTFLEYTGDSLAPMGVSAYELTSPLKRDFYTNVDPRSYCNMTKPLGQKTYTIDQSKLYTSISTGESFRTLTIDVDTLIGRKFVNEYLKDYGTAAQAKFDTFSNTDKLRQFFPGVYMASTFGSGSLINVNISALNIYYTYNYPAGNHDGTADTIMHDVFRLVVTPEVIQLNSIQNSFPNPNPLLTDPDAVYLKTPAGVCTEVQFPLQDIVRKMDALGSEKVIVNSGKFILNGYSEKESALKYDFGRPGSVLLIEKDSLNDFFLNPQKRKPDNKTSFYASWNSTTNSCSFTSLANLITAYREKIKNGLNHDPYFVILPVEVDAIQSSTTGTVSIRQVFNYMKPSTSVIRSGGNNMRFSYILSLY
ncbi:DUF4270 domain-containing protein [Viscerimonas tarda]